MKPGIIHPICLFFGHDFVTNRNGVTHCRICGKVVKA